MNKPCVSVVIPTYNYGHLLSRAVDSVLTQTFRDFEVLVVDDGSTDDTPKVLAGYGERIQAIRQDNAGVSAARNRGIAEARGEFIAFLDADDAWVPDKLEKQVAFLREHPQYDMVYSDISHYVDDRLVHHSYLQERGYTQAASGLIYDNILREGFIFVPTVMVRRECLEAVGGFDPGLSCSEDLDLWLRIAERHRIGFLKESLVLRHDHSRNATKNALQYLSCPIRVLTKALLALEGRGNPARRELILSRLGRMHHDLGYYLFVTGDARGCRREMWRSVDLGRPLAPALKYILLSYLPHWIVAGLRRIKGAACGREASC